MADKGKQGAVIVVKKQGGHAGHHGGAWKVAYADFVTAMMAFFLVMWIVGQSQQVKRHVAGYFTDPVAYSAQQKAAAGLLDGGQGVMQSAGTGVMPQVAPTPPAAAEAQVREALAKAGQEILDAMAKAPELSDVAGQIDVELTDEGLRIQLMESGNATFFDLGSAKLSPNGVKTVTLIGKTVAPLNKDVAVEGHTDSRPFGSGKGYSNWELSADRANSARRLLEEAGVEPRHVTEIRGYAATRLRYPESPEDPRNRRISIIVFSKYHGKDRASVDFQRGVKENLPLTGAPGTEATAAPAAR